MRKRKEELQKEELKKESTDQTQSTDQVQTGSQTRLELSEYTLLGNPWQDPDGSAQDVDNGGLEKLEQYNYFNSAQIADSIEVSKAMAVRGKKLSNQGNIQIIQVSTGFDRFEKNMLVQADAMGILPDSQTFAMRMIFNRKEVLQQTCDCPK